MKFGKKIIGLTKRVGIIKVSVHDKQLANSHINIGVKKTALNKFKDALVSFSDAIMLDPNNYKAYSLRGECKKNLKMYDSSLKDFERAIELNPEYAYAYHGRGISNYLKAYETYLKILGHSDNYSAAQKAIDDIIMASHLKPDDFFLLKKRSLFYEFVGEIGLAKKDLDRLIDMHPNDAELYKKRGDINHKRALGLNSSEACKDWLIAFELGDESAESELKNFCDEYQY